MNILRGGQKKSHCDLSLIKIDLFSRCFRPELHSEYLICKAQTDQNQCSSISMYVGVMTHMNTRKHTHTGGFLQALAL